MIQISSGEFMKKNKIKKASVKKSKKVSKQKSARPLVSVVIPTLNEQEWLVKCVAAIENQTIPRIEYEIIVVDSSSKDNTLKIAKKLADKVLVCERLGAGNGRNAGAKIARGKYIAFVDADTLVSKTWVEGIIEGLGKGIGVTGPFETIEKDSLKIELFFKWWNFQDFASTVICVPTFPGFNMAVRKREFEKLEGFRHITAEDLDLGLRMRKIGRVVYNKKMRVETSNRRLKEIPIFPYIWNGANFVLFGKSWSWKKHRKDFDS